MKRTFTVALLTLALIQNSSRPQTQLDIIVCRAPYFVVSPPNPKISGSTIAVVPTQSNLSETRAVGLAAYVYHQFNYKNSWKQLHIYVFKDKKTAQIFAAYQVKHKYQLLKMQDYKNPSRYGRTF